MHSRAATTIVGMATSSRRSMLRVLRAAPAAGPAVLGRDAERERKALRSVSLRGRCAAAAAAGAASTNPAHRAAAVAHRACPPTVLATAGQRLSARACDSASGAAAWAARSAGHPGATRSRLARLAADPDSALRSIAASAPAATRPLLLGLLTDDNHTTRVTAGMHPRTPPEVLDAASRTDPSMREAVASNLSAWPSTVQRLAADSEWDVRVAAAAHPSHTVDTLRNYCASLDIALEAGVASNPRCPEDLLVELSQHVEDFVRTWVALNPAADAATLEHIANGFEIDAEHNHDGVLEDYEPWEALAENPNSPPHLVERVIDAAGTLAQARAVANPNASAEMIESVVASTPPTEPDGLFGGSQGIVLCNAAENPNCPVALLPNLARDTNEDVRSAVAKHPQCPETLIEQLAGDGYAKVRARAASSAACSTTVLRVLIDNSDVDVAVAARLALAARGLI